jgi:UDP-N-acetylmuramate: L-alanyl-gamma-D-glutamyl-meso-diaminopimelate ligase
MNKTHFIAIGGAIMHQLAIALHHQGHIVSGSDDEINDPARTNLKNCGLLPESIGWFPEKIDQSIDAIVLGMHAKADNPELLAAQALGIPIYSFPEYVYKVCEHKKRVVIAGSHGKTSITSMIMHVLKHQNVNFDFLVGAKIEGFEQSVQLSDAPLIILEGDEYPASVIEKKPKIFFYHPHISVLSGIAWDHINVFPTYENYCSQFEQYLQLMPPSAQLYYNNEDSEVVRIVHKTGAHLHAKPYTTYPFHYDNGIAVLDTPFGEKAIKVFGKHNLLNLSAALKVCLSLGIEEKQFYEAIATFGGAARRLELLFNSDRLTVYRDFAHAPSKLKATLDAVKEAMPNKKVVACFELHTFSSLNAQFLKEYSGSMQAADVPLVFFSNHALALKRLPNLNTTEVGNYFDNEALLVFDNAAALQNHVMNIIDKSQESVCLLLMSSGTFDGIQWKF